MIGQPAASGDATVRTLLDEAELLANQDSVDYSPERAAVLWQAASEMGSLEATTKLADCYFYGRGRPEDDGEAARLYSMVLRANPDDSYCNYQLGRMSRVGWGMPVDANAAHDYLMRAWKMGEVGAASEMAFLSLYKDNPEVSDIEDGLRWLQRGAAKGDSRSNYRLGVIFNTGDYGVYQDKRRALDHLMRAMPDSRALAYLVSTDGLGIVSDEEYATLVEEALAQASRHQDAGLYKSLGCAYDDKTRLGSCPQKCEQYYRQALSLGDGFAGYLLGMNYRFGWSGFEEDLAKAESVLFEGANQGCVQAMAALGDLYRDRWSSYQDVHGSHVYPRDPEVLRKAFVWLEKAGLDGDTYAALHAGEAVIDLEDQNLLVRGARCLEIAMEDDIHFAYVPLARITSERGLPSFNPALALKALEKARTENVAEYEVGEVDYLTGVMFEEGVGCPKSANQAVECYLKASERGYEEAREALKRFKKGLLGWKVVKERR